MKCSLHVRSRLACCWLFFAAESKCTRPTSSAAMFGYKALTFDASHTALLFVEVHVIRGMRDPASRKQLPTTVQKKL